MLIELKSLREECGGCPTSYSGQTIDGKLFGARLRHGHMTIEIDEDCIVSRDVSSRFDGVCSFSDFQRVARASGYSIDDSNASWSSQLNDTEEAIMKMIKDRVKIEFVADLELKKARQNYKKGQNYSVDKKLADLFVEKGYAKFVV